MKTKLNFSIIFLLFTITASGQKDLDSLSNDVEMSLLAPTPVFRNGGDKGLMKFISDNIRFPKGQHLNGNVYVEFTVDSMGNLKNEKVIDGLTKEADSEALRIVRLMKFNPARAMGKPITAQHHVFINFNNGEE